ALDIAPGIRCSLARLLLLFLCLYIHQKVKRPCGTWAARWSEPLGNISRASSDSAKSDLRERTRRERRHHLIVLHHHVYVEIPKFLAAVHRCQCTTDHQRVSVQ